MPHKFDATAETNALVNGWLEEQAGLPITLSISKLGIRIVQALNAAYETGRSDGIREVSPDDGDPDDFDNMEFFADDSNEEGR
jgi:hypothetical protein